MIWLIIIALISIISIFFYILADSDDFGLAFLGAFLFGLMTTAALTAVVWGCLYPFTGPVHHTRQSQLVNLQDSPGTDGTFFLGIGQVSGNLTVTYYTNQNGYDSPNAVDSNDDTIRIYQDLASNSKPYVKRIEADPHFWTGSLFNGSNTPVEYDFHVPPGTVKQNYSLDAQ